MTALAQQQESPEEQILRVINGNGANYLDIAGRVNVPSGSLTRHLNSLVSAGRLERVRNGFYRAAVGLLVVFCALPAAAQRGVLRTSNVQTVPNVVEALPSLPAITRISEAAAFTPTNRLRAAITIVPNPPEQGITNYVVHYGAAPRTYTNAVSAGTNLSVTISNLMPLTRYYFAATAQNAQGISGLGEESFWPLPLTNYVTVSVSRRATLDGPRTTLWSLTLTNPPHASEFFETTLTLTNNQSQVLRLSPSTVLLSNTNQPAN